MRVALDTNILISALLLASGHPAAIYRAWIAGRFTLVTCEEQIEEFRAALQKPALAERIRPHRAGRLVNELRRVAEMAERLPRVRRSPDPNDDYLLALAEAGRADYLVTGDKSGLLALGSHGGTRIVSAREFAAEMG
ncbi:MAG: putative toxin-antitoxin system toxin component, PIN family [Acidobacteriaceae bacterium]